MARAALFQVAEIDSPEALAVLKQVIATSKDPEMRRTALMAMGEHGGPEAKDALVKIALTSADDEDGRDGRVRPLREPRTTSARTFFSIS